MKVAVMIPCYNEELTIEKVIKDFNSELPEADIYVYDNNSVDNTYNIALNSGAIVKRESKQGKGNVVRSMFRDIEADVYIMVDGDDTYPAEEVHKLIDAVINKNADMVIGDRLSNGTYAKENKRKFHGLGNGMVKLLVNTIYKSKLQDIMTGYRAFSKKFVKTMPVLSDKFEIETEMSLHALDKKFNIVELPITYRDRPEGSTSKLNTISDGYKVIKMLFLIAKDYKPFLIYFLLSLIFFAFSLLVGIPVIVDFYKTGLVAKFPSAILAMGLMLISAMLSTCAIILDTIVNNNKRNYEISLNIFKLFEKNNKSE